MNSPLIHKNPKASDEELVAEANADFKKSRLKQVMAILDHAIREHQFHGLTDEDVHKEFPAAAVMGWLKNRPDRRQQILTELVGTKPNMARKRDLAKQAQDIEDAIECGDITVKDYRNAVTSEDIVTYGPCEQFFRIFFERFDWSDTKDPKKQAVVAMLKNEFVAVEPGLKPILTHLEMRRAISSVAWNRFLPAELRAKIDDARLEKQEKTPRDPFTAKEEFEIVPPEELVKHIPLDELTEVFRCAGKSMGFTVPGADDEKKPESPVTLKVEDATLVKDEDVTDATPTKIPPPMKETHGGDGDEAPKSVPKPPPLPGSAYAGPTPAKLPAGEDDLDFDEMLDKSLGPNADSPKGQTGPR